MDSTDAGQLSPRLPPPPTTSISLPSGRGQVTSTGTSSNLPAESSSASRRPSSSGVATESPSFASVPLPEIPAPHDIHEHWEPKYQAVAKCDFCHCRVSNEKTAGVLQLCRDCKMSICHDCCLQRQEAAKGRVDALQLHGKAEQLTESQRRWCRFGIQARHSLDPDAVNWELPAKKQQAAASKRHPTAQARGSSQVRRRGRRKNTTRGGGQLQADSRKRSQLSVSQTPSEFVTDPDVETASIDGTDDWRSHGSFEGAEEDGSSISHRVTRGSIRRSDAVQEVSSDCRAAERAAEVLVEWAASPAVGHRDGYKRIKLSHPTDYPTPVAAPARPSLYEDRDRPSLPSLTSILPTLRNEEEPPSVANFRGAAQLRPTNAAHRSRGRITRGESPRLAPHYSEGHEQPRGQGRLPGDYTYSHGYSGHQEVIPQDVNRNGERYGSHSPERRGPERRNMSAIPQLHQPDYHWAGSARDPYHAHYSAAQYTGPPQSSGPSVYNNIYEGAYASRPSAPNSSPQASPTPPQQPLGDVQALAARLQTHARSAHAADSRRPLDECLTDELGWAWRALEPAAARSSPYADRTALDEQTVRSFELGQSAAWIAMFQLGIERDLDNAVRDWLRRLHRWLQSSGVPVPPMGPADRALERRE